MSCKTCTSQICHLKKRLCGRLFLCVFVDLEKHIFVACCVFKVLLFCRLSILSRPWLRFHQKILLACSKDSWSDGVGMCLPCNPIPAKGFHPNTTVGHASPDCPWVFFWHMFSCSSRKIGENVHPIWLCAYFFRWVGWLVQPPKTVGPYSCSLGVPNVASNPYCLDPIDYALGFFGGWKVPAIFVSGSQDFVW